MNPFMSQLKANGKPAETFEEEKSHIISYEDGWDEWDGPIWPYKEVKFEMPGTFFQPVPLWSDAVTDGALEMEKTTAAHHSAGMRDVSPPEKHPGDH
jgi:hypothetical protein